jgi:hypothetical protein
MIKFLVPFLLAGLFVGCQMAPTTALEESVDVFAARTVLVDTRSALDFNSFNIKGSTNLLVDDFVVLQNPLAKPKNQKRYFDSNLKNMIERLARRGIHPSKKIILIGTKKDSIENKKWKWMLNNLEISEVSMYSLDQVRKIKHGNFAEVEAEQPWEMKLSSDEQKEFILNKAQKCFIDAYPKNKKWNEEYCH